MSALLEQVTDAFNRHGAFTARADHAARAVEVRRIETGAFATVVLLPTTFANRWSWRPRPNGEIRVLPPEMTVEELVRAVATSLLDEGLNR